MRLPNPSTSRVILIGTATYEDPEISDLPAVVANVTDLAEVLTDPGFGGLDPGSCHSFVDLSSDRVWEIAEVARQAEDVLLVYFAGHGLLGDDGRLLLGMTNTKFSYPEFTALHVDQLVRAIETSRARIRMFVLDCCYSERALKHMGTPAQQLIIEGTYTLASAPANRSAVAPAGERHTAFTGELISLLRSGDPGAEELLSVSAVFGRLVAALRAKGYPTPKQANSGTASALALVRNVAFHASHPAPPPQPPPTSAVDLRRSLLRPTSPAAQRLAALDTLIQRARTEEDCADELEMLAVNGYLPMLLRLACVYALDTMWEKSRAVAAAATIVDGADVGQVVVARLRLLMGPLVETPDGLTVRMLGAPPDTDWGRRVVTLLTDLGLPALEQLRTAEALMQLGCHDNAMALLRASDVPGVHDVVEQATAGMAAEASAGDTFSPWPIQPLLGEPPLTLFRGKRTVVLSPGTQVDRYGDPVGNVTYEAGTPFPARSVVPGWVRRPYHAYRIVAPVDALTGTAIPWFEQPGGGTAFVLSHSVADLLSAGALTEVERSRPDAAVAQ